MVLKRKIKLLKIKLLRFIKFLYSCVGFDDEIKLTERDFKHYKRKFNHENKKHFKKR